MNQSIEPNALYCSQHRFGMYRWHIMDPIRFEKDLRVTIQDFGLAFGRTVLAAAERYRVHRLLVPSRAACVLPGAAGQ